MADADRAQHAEQWDDSSDERERLADERERLADERERLADERERLADQDEIVGDRRLSNIDETLVTAREQLLRAEARVERALAAEERARAAVERVSQLDDRHHAGEDRLAHSSLHGEGEEATWAFERHDFVAADRGRLANARDDAADARDEVARLREQEADRRERDARRREEILTQYETDLTGEAAKLDQPTERARRDLVEVRETGRRQRATATETRRQAATDRADAERRRAANGAVPDEYGRSLVGQFTALTRELFASQDVIAVAERVAALAVDCIPGVVAAGVTLFEGVSPTRRVSTDAIAHQLDAYQLAKDEGPVGESIERGHVVVVGRLEDDGRWPSLATVAGALGVAGIGACGLAVRRGTEWQTLGVLTIYADTAGALNGAVGDDLSLLAAHLSLVAAFDRDRQDVSRREAALHRALSSRDVIGQAKGVLMERQRISAGAAFDTLRRASQRLNIRLEEIAKRLTETGELSQ